MAKNFWLSAPSSSKGLRTENGTALKKKGKDLHRWGDVTSGTLEMMKRAGKLSLNEASVGLKAYQMSKHVTAVYGTMRQDFTTL